MQNYFEIVPRERKTSGNSYEKGRFGKRSNVNIVRAGVWHRTRNHPRPIRYSAVVAIIKNFIDLRFEKCLANLYDFVHNSPTAPEKNLEPLGSWDFLVAFCAKIELFLAASIPFLRM